MFLIYHYIDSIKKQLRKRERYPEMNDMSEYYTSQVMSEHFNTSKQLTNLLLHKRLR